MQTERLILRERTVGQLKKIESADKQEQFDFFGLTNNDALLKEIDRIKKGQYNNFYSGVYFDLVLKENKEVIGSAGFHTWWRDHNRAEIGYSLNDEKNRRQGFMNEVLPIILDYGFKKMQLHRVEAYTAMDNVASIALLQKFGFKKEATIHGRYKMPDGTYEDDYLFYLLNM
jgi:ribosomal-protein-alanine N-acetyltransferase